MPPGDLRCVAQAGDVKVRVLRHGAQSQPLAPSPPIGAHRVTQQRGSLAILAFADLCMEAICEFDVKNMPVTVAVSSDGTSVHTTGPRA